MPSTVLKTAQEHNGPEVLRLLIRMRQLRLLFLLAVAGAVSFWLPDVVVHMIARGAFDRSHIWTITFLLPATFLLAYFSWQRCANLRVGWASIAMLAGVWLSGGLFMMISATVSGGGFATSGVGGAVFVLAISVIPIFAIDMATYDGSLFALLGVIVIAFVLLAIEYTVSPFSRQRHTD